MTLYFNIFKGKLTLLRMYFMNNSKTLFYLLKPKEKICNKFACPAYKSFSIKNDISFRLTSQKHFKVVKSKK